MFLDKEEEVVYYDPCESPEELGNLDGVTGLPGDQSVEVRRLSRQCQRLESQRGRICARRACLRNRQVGVLGGGQLSFPSPSRDSSYGKLEVLKGRLSTNTVINFLCVYIAISGYK